MTNDVVERPARRRTRRLLPWLPWLLFGAWGLLIGITRWRSPAPVGHFSDSFAAAPEFPQLPAMFGEHRLGGTVLGPAGTTLADALVFVREGDEAFWERTDGAGRFELLRLPPPPWRVVVVARGHEPRSFAIDGGDGTAVTLALDTAFGDPPDYPRRERSALAGRVVPALATADASGFEIYLRPIAPHDEFGMPFPRRAATTADGSFRIADLDHGRYELLVFPPWASGGTWPDLAAPRALGEPFEIVHPLGTDEFLVELATGAVAGRMTNLRGAFLAGALIMLERADDPARMWPPTTTDENGAFRFDHVPPGQYLVRAQAGAGHTEQRIEVVRGTVLRLDLDPLHTAAAEDDRAR